MKVISVHEMTTEKYNDKPWGNIIHRIQCFGFIETMYDQEICSKIAKHQIYNIS